MMKLKQEKRINRTRFSKGEPVGNQAAALHN